MRRATKRAAAELLSIVVLAAATLLIPNALSRQTETSSTALTSMPRPAAAAGSAAVGSTSYPVPASAVFVSPWGRDDAAGLIGSPVATINRAVAIVPAGGTIVLRAGTYYQSVTIQTKPVTIQSYPHEAVWLDGAPQVTGWVAQGAVWRRDGWTTRFDHSPTYTQGRADNTEPTWSFLNAAHPLAAYPDQLWVDGVAAQQVGSLAEVTAGTFYLDEQTSQLYIGNDPVNHDVTVSMIAKAITVQSAGTVLRGFGVMHYAPSVWMMGAITLERPGITVENLVISDNATTGISASSSGATLRSLTVERNGLLGVQATGADGLRLLSVAARYNNSEHFNQAPVSGGFKVTSSRGVLVKNSTFSQNDGPGGWFDCSSYDLVVVGNNFTGNADHGISFEISAKVLFADNLVVGNAGNGVKVNDTSEVNIWNNTFVGNGRPINLVQDDRRASPVTAANLDAHDLRQPLPDPSVTWLLGPVDVSNNVIGQQAASADCLVCVEDYSHERTAAQLGVTSNGNVYNRPAGAPGWAAIWSGGASPNPLVFTSFAAFSVATGQDASRYAVDGTTVVSADGALTAPVIAAQATVAQVLPAEVAAATGWPTTSKHLGAWL